MNRCFWSKVFSWLWGGVKEIGEVIAMAFCVILFMACAIGIVYALTDPLPVLVAGPVVGGVIFLLRLLFHFLVMTMLIKNSVFEAGKKLREFMKECGDE